LTSFAAGLHVGVEFDSSGFADRFRRGGHPPRWIFLQRQRTDGVRAVLSEAQSANIGRLPVLLPHDDGANVLLRVGVARGQAPAQATDQHMRRSGAANVAQQRWKGRYRLLLFFFHSLI